MSLVWLKIAVLLYGIASLAVLPAVLYERPQWRYAALPAALLGLFFHSISLAQILAAAHHLVPVEATEIQAVLALLLVVAFLLTAAVYRTLTMGVVLLPVATLLCLVPAFALGKSTLASPLLRSGWIWLHIALLLAAYAALILSLLASVLYLIQEKRLKSRSTKGPIGALPPLATTDAIVLKSLLFGLPCMTAGLLIGSLLAMQMYGASYFHDPKVLLSFVMWLAYVAMIAIRRSAGLRGRRAVFLSAFVFFVMLAVWSANQFSSVHQFAVER